MVRRLDLEFWHDKVYTSLTAGGMLRNVGVRW